MVSTTTNPRATGTAVEAQRRRPQSPRRRGWKRNSRIFLWLATAVLVRLWFQLKTMGENNDITMTQQQQQEQHFQQPQRIDAGTMIFSSKNGEGNLTRQKKGSVNSAPANRTATAVSTESSTTNNNSSSGSSSSSNHTMGFVHMGKTGGSTISQLLRNGCHSFVPKPCRTVPNETLVSRRVRDYYHVPDFWRLPESTHRSFVISVRDPFDRTVSALLYHHPRNVARMAEIEQRDGTKQQLQRSKREVKNGERMYQCFPTVEDFAGLLRRGNRTDCNHPYASNMIVMKNCSEFACAVLHGRVRPFLHLFYNYRNILSKLLPPPGEDGVQRPEPELHVIRKEHLWEDWWDLNRRLGGDGGAEGRMTPTASGGANAGGNARNITGMDLPVTREISPGGRDRLCLALETEYAAYYRILSLTAGRTATSPATAGGTTTTKIDDDVLAVASANCPHLDHERLLREASSRSD